MSFRKTFFSALLTLLAFYSFAQTKTHYTKTEMKKNPVWIAMISDDHVNYFEALKAFELYFTTHPFPVMEEEEMAKNEKLKARIEKSEARFKKKKRKVKEDPNAAQKEKHEE